MLLLSVARVTLSVESWISWWSGGRYLLDECIALLSPIIFISPSTARITTNQRSVSPRFNQSDKSIVNHQPIRDEYYLLE